LTRAALPPDPRTLAAEVLALTGGEAQVTVTRERSLFSRFAGSVPTQATAIDVVTVHVLSVVDGHTGGAICTALDPDALRAATRSARLAAEAAARSGTGPYPGLPVPVAAPAPTAASATRDGWDPLTAHLDPTAAGGALTAAFATATEHALEAFGIWTAGDVETALASSHGLDVVDRVTDGYLKVVCRDAVGRAGFAARTGIGIDALDGALVAAEAADRVARCEPAVLEPGAYPVVLDHDAVGSILDMLAGLAFNGLAQAEGRGALVGRLGTQVAAPTVTLTDAPRFAATLPRAFDAEGVPKAATALIVDGIARAVTHDTRSAAVAGDGARSTGHALEPGGSAWGAIPTNLVLHGGSAASLEELAAPIERGLLISRLWYLNPLHERSATVTGVSREGTFLIEDGRVTRPLRDIRFTDSLLRILAETEALTTALRLVSEAEYYGTRLAYGSVTPALRAAGFRISGGA
jgi:predicted Zn-dependent protease